MYQMRGGKASLIKGVSGRIDHDYCHYGLNFSAQLLYDGVENNDELVGYEVPTTNQCDNEFVDNSQNSFVVSTANDETGMSGNDIFTDESIIYSSSILLIDEVLRGSLSGGLFVPDFLKNDRLEYGKAANEATNSSPMTQYFSSTGSFEGYTVATDALTPHIVNQVFEAAEQSNLNTDNGAIANDIVAGDSIDSVSTGSGDSLLKGGSGNDVLTGVEGNDILTDNEDSLTGVRTNYALIVGIGDYQDASDDLAGVAYDVADMQYFLSHDAQWNDTNVTTIQDSQATKVNITSALNKLASQVDVADNVMLYYSGHGRAGTGSLVTWDYESITTEMMYHSMEAIAGKVGASGHVTLVLDSCFSGKFVDYFRAKGMDSRITVLSACSSYEYSYDIGSNGEFTSYLLDGGLTGKKADFNKDGSITTQEIFTYLTSTSGYQYDCTAQMYDGSGGKYVLG